MEDGHPEQRGIIRFSLVHIPLLRDHGMGLIQPVMGLIFPTRISDKGVVDDCEMHSSTDKHTPSHIERRHISAECRAGCLLI